MQKENMGIIKDIRDDFRNANLSTTEKLVLNGTLAAGLAAAGFTIYVHAQSIRCDLNVIEDQKYCSDVQKALRELDDAPRPFVFL